MSSNQIDFVWRRVPLDVHYDYQPREPMTWEHPGEPESLTVTAVFVKGGNGVDIVELIGDDGCEDLQVDLLIHLHNLSHEEHCADLAAARDIWD